MPKPDLKDLSTANEIELTVKGRKSGQEISSPVWFVHEDDKIAAHEQELSGEAKTITETDKVKELVQKFKSKYGNSDVQKYYSKFDVGVEFSSIDIK